MELHLENGPAKDQLVATPQGDLDLYASVEFCNQVTRQMEAGRPQLILNFSQVRYLDSSGVGAVIRLVQKARSLKGEVRVVGLTGTPRKVLEMSNIISLVKVFATLDEAKAGS